MSYRLYITYTLIVFLFGLDQSNVCSDIDKIEGLIGYCLPIPQKLHNVTKRLSTKEEVEEYFPGFLVFVDCTEQPIHIKTQEQVKTKVIPFWQEKETRGKEPVHCKSKGDDNLQIQTQSDIEVGMKHDYKSTKIITLNYQRI